MNGLSAPHSTAPKKEVYLDIRRRAYGPALEALCGELEIWEVLQSVADALQERKGKEPQRLRRKPSTSPSLRLATIDRSVPTSTVEEVRAVIVEHMPIPVHLNNAIPRPYAQGC